MTMVTISTAVCGYKRCRSIRNWKWKWWWL